MRRFLPAAVIALLMVAVATPAHAGYLIIRVILEGGGSGGGFGGDDSGGMGSGMRMGGSGGFGRGMSSASPPGGAPGGFGRGMSGMSPPGAGGLSSPVSPGAAGTGDSSGPAAHDPTRSLVVVVPVEEDLRQATAFYQKTGANPNTNPIWKPKLHLKHRGERFVTNIFTDNVSVQLYESLIQTPG